METHNQTGTAGASGQAVRSELETQKRPLAVISASTTAEDLCRIAAHQLIALKQSVERNPHELRALLSDPNSADRTVDQILQLFHCLNDQAEVWERTSAMPISMPEGTSSRNLGVRLLKEALSAFTLASEALQLIPYNSLDPSLKQRIARLNDDAGFALKMKRASISLQLAQVLPTHEGMLCLNEATRLMDEAEADRPAARDDESVKMLRESVPVLRTMLHLL